MATPLPPKARFARSGAGPTGTATLPQPAPAVLAAAARSLDTSVVGKSG